MGLLVLSRKRGEELILTLPDGRLIRVGVCEVRHDGKVRIGIQADRDVQIDRLEIHNLRQREASLPELRPMFREAAA